MAQSPIRFTLDDIDRPAAPSGGTVRFSLGDIDPPDTMAPDAPTARPSPPHPAAVRVPDVRVGDIVLPAEAVAPGAPVPPTRRVGAPLPRSGPAPRRTMADVLVPGRRHDETVEGRIAGPGAAFQPGDTFEAIARQSTGQLPRTDYYAEVTAQAPDPDAPPAEPRIGAAPRTTAQRALDVPRSVAAGVLSQTSAGFWGLVQAGADAVGMPNVAAFAADAGQTATAAGAAVRGPLAGAGPTERALYSGLESVGGMVAGFLAAPGFGAPATLGIMGGATAGTSYAEARKQGASPMKAAAHAGVSGVVEVLTEKMPVTWLLSDLAKNAGLVKTITHQAMAEIPGEQVATAFQDLSAWAFLPENRDKTFRDYLAERPGAAYETLVATITATVGLSVGAVAMNRLPKPSSADVARDGVGGDAARLVTDDALDAALGAAGERDITFALSQAPPDEGTKPAAVVGPQAPPPSGADRESSPTTAAGIPPGVLPPEFTPMGEEPAPPTPAPPVEPGTDALIDRVLDKSATGQQLGSDELRRSLEQRQALDEARPDEPPRSGTTEIPSETGGISGGPGASAEPVRLSEPPEQPVVGVRYEMPARALSADPASLQYRRVTNQAGVEAERAITTPYDPLKGGVLAVWRNPKDGKDYVVNGHHRLDRAKQDDARIAVIYIDAPNAKSARSAGALLNLQEDSTSLPDAVQYMVDAGIRPEGLAAVGISPRAKVSRQAAAIASLEPHIRRKWENGELPDDIAAAIGVASLTVEQQEAAADFYTSQEARGRTITPPVMVRALDRITDAPVVEDGPEDMFGNKQTRNVFADRMDLESYVLRELGKDKSRLRAAIREKDRLARANTQVDVDKAQELADESARAQAILDKVMRAKGPISDILNTAAAEVAEGGNLEAIRARVLADVTKAAEVELGSGAVNARRGPPRRRRHQEDSPSAVPERAPAGRPEGTAEDVAPTALSLSPSEQQEVPPGDTLNPELRAILDRAYPNFPRHRWVEVEPGVLEQAPDEQHRQDGFRFDLRGDRPVIASLGKKAERQLVHYHASVFDELLKRHPNLRNLIGQPVEAPRSSADLGPVNEADDNAPRSYSSTQVNLPSEVGDRLRALAATIPEADLAEDGREEDAHITVQYGIDNDDVEPLRQALAGLGPVTVRFGKTSLFENEDADVVKVDVDSPDLRRVREAIRAVVDAPGDTHPAYVPHATVAYVKPGRGQAYAGRTDLQGQTATIDRITFSTRDRRTIEIPLTGMQSGRPRTYWREDMKPSEMLRAWAASSDGFGSDFGQSALIDAVLKATARPGYQAGISNRRRSGPPVSRSEQQQNVRAWVEWFEANRGNTPTRTTDAAPEPQVTLPEAGEKPPKAPVKATAENIARVLGIPDDQAAALRALFEAVLMDRADNVQMVRGGEPAADALTDDPVLRDLATLKGRLRRVLGSTQALDALKALRVTGPMVNIETGLAATLSRDAIDKLLSKSAVQKSVSSQAHMMAVGNLDHLFRVATQVDERASAKAPEVVRTIRVFDAPMPFGDDVLRVRMLTRTYRREADGTRLYFVEAVRIERPDRGAVLGAEATGAPRPHSGPSTHRFAQMVAAVKRGSGQLYQSDRLPTGEEQPRLPGAVGDVRDQEVPTPREALPDGEFRLTAPPVKARRPRQDVLFQLEGEPLFELLEDTDVNAGGESAASAEAISRLRGMRARGETFAVRTRGGAVRPLIGPDAVDVVPGPNQDFGILRADGSFQVLTRGERRLYQAVWQGQGVKGSVEFLQQDAQALIRAFASADVSTGVHELAHIARRWLLNRDIPAENRRGISDEDIRIAEEWSGAKNGVWDRDAEEKFARGFERYLRDGGPTLPGKLRAIFGKFAAWLSDVYRSVQGSSIDVEISPAMQGVYERLVTRAERNAKLAGQYKPNNPFAEKAVRARERADRLNQPTARERAMAEAFPLGAGFGRKGDAKRVDRSVDRAVEAVAAEKTAREWEAKAEAFDRGEINAQGRRWDADKQERSDKRASAQEKREARIAAAKAAREGQERWEVRAEVYADSTGSLAGSARNLVLSDHRAYVEQALADGKAVPADVLADYPDLAPPKRTAPSGLASTKPDGKTLAVKTGTIPRRLGRTLFADEDVETEAGPEDEPSDLAPRGAIEDLTVAHPILLPELVELAKALMGTPQVVKRFRGDRRWGDFLPVGRGRIRILGSLFARTEVLTNENTPVGARVKAVKGPSRDTWYRVTGHGEDGRPVLEPEGGGETVGVTSADVAQQVYVVDVAERNTHQLAQTLAHEIGHLVDWLPDKTLKRGNLLGRLQTLHDFLAHTFTARGGEVIHVDDVRRELIEVSKQWRGDFNEKGQGSHDRYRASGKELYADAISALLNNPGWLEQEAPTFYRLFFEHLDQKPDVRTAYFGLQELLSGTPTDLIVRRRGNVRRMFGLGEAKSRDVQALMNEERRLSRQNLTKRLRIEFIDKNTPVRDAEVDKPGATGSYALREMRYLRGQQEAFLQRTFQPVYQAVLDAGIDWATFGEALFYERIEAGDRGEIANPLGHTPDTVPALYAALKQGLTTDQRAVLEQQIGQFRAAVREVAEYAYASGLYKQDLWEKMQKNPAWASFRVIDHMDSQVTSTVHQQIGTLKEVQNPADATILKTLVTLRAIEFNEMKKQVFRSIGAEAVEAKRVWGGRGLVPEAPKDRKLALVTYMQDGHQHGKHVPQDVADAIENKTIGANLAALEALRLANRTWFRPVFTTMNTGFQAANLVRDFLRYWSNMPKATLRSAAVAYWQAIPMARVRAFGLQEGAAAKYQQAWADMREAKEAKILSATMTDLFAGNLEDTAIEQVFADSGLVTSPVERGRIRRLLDFIENTGNFIETLPKAAAIYEFTGADRTIADLTARERAFIREKVGSPDFLQGGTLKPVTNELFLFSNAIVQAVRADIEVATDPDSRGAFWRKNAAAFMAPVALTFLIEHFGHLLGGDDDDEHPENWTYVQQILRGVTEYDKTNYTIIPIALDSEGNSIYLRIPRSDSGRLLGAMVRKLLMAGGGDADLGGSLAAMFDYMAGHVPGTTPAVSLAVDLADYASGRNVYDRFRGREVFSDDEMRAGGMRKAERFLSYEFQQLGGGIVYRVGFDRPSKDTPAQKVLALPVVSNVVGRFIRITQHGQTERLRQSQARAQAGESATRLSRQDEIREAVRAYMALPVPSRSKARSLQMAQAIARKVYVDASEAERATRAKDIAKRIRMGAVRGEADPLTDVVMGARSNAERSAVILDHFQDDATALMRWLRRAVAEEVLSKAAADEVLRQRGKR